MSVATEDGVRRALEEAREGRVDGEGGVGSGREEAARER